jgi:hypothetical protein
MSTPVSWFLIEPGWTVEAADGSELGRVEEVTGDSNADVFDGLTVASTIVAQPRYVPSELVGEIVEGRVRLNIDRPTFEHLHESSAQVPLTRRALEWLGRVGKR